MPLTAGSTQTVSQIRADIYEITECSIDFVRERISVRYRTKLTADADWTHPKQFSLAFSAVNTASLLSTLYTRAQSASSLPSGSVS